MAATALYFAGRLTRQPNAYSDVDYSALDSVGVSASGIVAVLGTAKGGTPYTAISNDDVPGTTPSSSRPGKAKTLMKSGDLLEAESFLFNPSNDEEIKGGAQQILWLQVNPSTQSSGTATNSNGDALELTSIKYGYDTTQISYEIATGTGGAPGKKYVINYNDEDPEVFDDVGADEVFKLQYTATVPANGFTTCTLAITSTHLTSLFTRTQAGLNTDVTNQPSGVTITASSSNGADTMEVTIYGDTASGAAIETITLDGTNDVTTQTTWTKFFGAWIASAPAGTVTLEEDGGSLTITTLTSGNMTKGLGVASDMPCASIVTAVAGGASTDTLAVVGLNTSGQALIEKVTLNGTTPVPGTSVFTKILYMAMGNVAAATTVTFSGTAVQTAHDTFNVTTAASKFEAGGGFSFTVVTGLSNFDLTNMDYYSATDVKSSEQSFYAALYDAVTAINDGSGRVTAARSSGGSGAPDNTSAAVYLTGGHEGDATPGNESTPTATSTDWQNCLDLAKRLFCNTIQCVTADPAIHAMLKTHINWMAGPGRGERDTVVGLMNSGQTGLATKTEIKSQIVALNDRNIRAVAQGCKRYNSNADLAEYNPQFTALIAAGMQAGAAEVGTPLTKKYMNVSRVTQDTGWNPTDDAEDMLKMGLMFAEVIEGQGIRWMRNITTHLTSDNIARTEASANQAVNWFTYNYRTALESQIGKKGFDGTKAAADGVARNILRIAMKENIIIAWRSLDWALTLDVLENSVEVAPVLPINFIPAIIHLISVPITL